MLSRLRAVGRAAAAGVVVAVAVAGCGSRAAPLAQPGSAAISPVSDRGAVPWVNQPGRIFQPRPLPVHWRPANARPCVAAQLRVSPDGGNGATGRTFTFFAFRNVGRTTCILRGFPSVVASEPGETDVIAAHSSWFVGGERSGNMGRGGITTLSIETDRDCPARYANPNTYPTLIYHTVTIGIPGGGHLVIRQALDVLCGLYTGRFAVAQPPQRYTESPVHAARVALELPSGVIAGSTLHYVADVTNPTGADLVLHLCPGYFQGLGSAGETILALNCQAQRTIPAHRTVRFAMQLRVPASTPTGPDTVYWQIAAPLGASARGTLRVDGRDTPCKADQLRASITGPGQVPGPPNLLGEKGMATEVPLTVMNVSGRPCSVDGAPSVSIGDASASSLGLRQVPGQHSSCGRSGGPARRSRWRRAPAPPVPRCTGTCLGAARTRIRSSS